MDGRFFTYCVRNIIEKAVSICVIIPQNRKVKKFQLQIINQSFERNGIGISYRKKLEKRKVHPSCKHGVRRICQLHTKGGPADKLTWCEPLETIWIIVDKDNMQRSSPKTLDELRLTTLRLEECDCGHALGTRTFYTSPLRKCQKTYRNWRRSG